MELRGSICKTESSCTQTMVAAAKRDENDDSHWAIRRDGVVQSELQDYAIIAHINKSSFNLPWS